MRKILPIITIILAFTLALQSASPVLAAPALSLSRTTGSPGNSLTVTGSGFTANETGIIVLWDSSSIASGLVADSSGGWSTTLIIPASTAGNHFIDARGDNTTDTAITPITFAVVPGISINRVSGPAGSSVIVTGSGFAASETGITVTYDSVTVASSISANSLGGWTTTITVPVSASGSHTIDAFGSVSLATSVTDVTFTITSGISLSPANGPPRSSVTVTGSGFVVGEAITITFDGSTIATATANSQGGWTVTFLVPSSSFGSHKVDAFGSITPATSVADVNFTITAGITVSPTSGTPGSQITVSGSAFNAGETGISVTYDGTTVASTTANAQGIWSVTFAVPASVSGTHIIDASGSATSATSIADINFTVEPVITLNKTSGSPGTSINVVGAGFNASDRSIAVLYDGVQVTLGAANNQGGWTATFVVPDSTAGTHVINAQGSVTLSGSVNPVSFSVTPSISINPAFGGVGTIVKVSGSGFAAKSNLRFAFGDIDLSSEGAVTDAIGSFEKSITMPNLKFGAHTISVVDGQKNESSLPFTMENTPPPVPRLISPQDGTKVGITGGGTPTLRWSGVTDPSGVTYTLQIDNNPDFVQPIVERPGLSGTSYTLTKTEALPYGQYYWRVRAIDGASNQSAWAQGWTLKSGLISLGALIIIIVAVVLVGIVVYIILARLAARRREFVPVAETGMPPIISAQWRTIETEEAATKPRALPWRWALPQPTKGTKVPTPEEQARLKVIADFASSLPLVEPGYNVKWLIDLLEASTGIEASPQVYGQLLRGELTIRYEPAWMRHPLYSELTSLLEGQPITQELNNFVEAVDHCASEAVSLLREIYRDAIVEILWDFLAKGGWGFISAVYSDAISWFRGKSLLEPSERDYTIKSGASPDEGTGILLLYGEENTTFPGLLIQAADEKEAAQLRALHLRLRRTYRSSNRAQQLVSMMAQLEVQRARLVSIFSRFGSLTQ